MADLIEKLKEIGLNTYEAKVYVALLKKYPATGYEVSKLANIPQSRTYDTLKVLEEKNIVVSTNTRPVSYTPIKPKVLTQRVQKKMSSTLSYLDKHLPNVKEDYNEPIITVTGKQNIQEDSQFDAIISAFALRNFQNLDKCLMEMKRVLVPQGKLVAIDLCTPVSFPMKQLFWVYKKVVMPLIGRFISHDHHAYTYLPETMDTVPKQTKWWKSFRKQV